MLLLLESIDRAKVVVAVVVVVGVDNADLRSVNSPSHAWTEGIDTHIRDAVVLLLAVVLLNIGRLLLSVVVYNFV